MAPEDDSTNWILIAVSFFVIAILIMLPLILVYSIYGGDIPDTQCGIQTPPSSGLPLGNLALTQTDGVDGDVSAFEADDFDF